MKGPFPGMDPYLEHHWLDVHTRLVTYAADWLNEHLPAELVATTEEREVRDAPSVLPVDLDPITERFVKVMDSSGERLVSVVEVVSPTNKRSPGLEKYVEKREELLGSDVHVVEVDL